MRYVVARVVTDKHAHDYHNSMAHASSDSVTAADLMKG